MVKDAHLMYRGGISMDNIDKKEVLCKEIELVQACINRMAHNSFIIKGWLITLLTVVLALLPENFNVRIICIIGFVVIFSFWYLDAFFLKMEKLYRWKYEWIIENRLKSDKYMFDLTPTNSNMWLQKKGRDGSNIPKTEPTILRVMFTKTLLPLYAPWIAIIICILICYA